MWNGDEIVEAVYVYKALGPEQCRSCFLDLVQFYGNDRWQIIEHERDYDLLPVCNKAARLSL